MAEYMALCLGHPEYGYYMTRDPFGAQGDFTTAPEISQMFGELIGAWCLQVWHDLGEPEKFHLIECGPGRGTLMQDILRICFKNTALKNSANVCLIETSPFLKKRQQETLSGFDNVTWYESFADVDADAPVIFIANELLDALPIHQFVKRNSGWAERAVGLNEQDAFERVLIAPSFDPRLIYATEDIETDTIVEFCPAAQNLVQDIARCIQGNRGAALFIDYGYIHEGYGDTLQALQKQGFVDILSSPGECDLTAHVNFYRLKRVADQVGLLTQPLTTQGQFLKNLGIDLRAQMLKSKNPSDAYGIDQALKRLTDDSEMGELFKVFGFSDTDLNIAGFENVYI